MASGTDNDKLVYVMNVLAHTELPQPDYKALAAKVGQSNANNAQKKFKAIVESLGFKLVERQVVPADGSNGATVPKTPKNYGRSKSSTPASSAKKSASKSVSKGRKRKVEEITEDEDDESDEIADFRVKEEAAGTPTGGEDDLEVTGDKRVKRARSVTVKAEVGGEDADETEA